LDNISNRKRAMSVKDGHKMYNYNLRKCKDFKCHKFEKLLNGRHSCVDAWQRYSITFEHSARREKFKKSFMNTILYWKLLIQNGPHITH